MKTILDAAKQSTCKKRVTVCVIFDASGDVLASESNRCNPPDGECTRLARSDGQASYPSASGCFWEHAEQRAVRALHPDAKPVRALLCGHDFPCPDCEAALRAAGVTHIDVEPTLFGTGLRPVAPPTASCLVCGHLRELAVWHGTTGDGVCRNCRDARHALFGGALVTTPRTHEEFYAALHRLMQHYLHEDVPASYGDARFVCDYALQLEGELRLALPRPDHEGP